MSIREYVVDVGTGTIIDRAACMVVAVDDGNTLAELALEANDASALVDHARLVEPSAGHGKALRALANQTATLVEQEERIREMEVALGAIAERAHLAWLAPESAEEIFTDLEAMAALAAAEKDKLTFDEVETLGLDGTLPSTLQGLDRDDLMQLVKAYRSGALGHA